MPHGPHCHRAFRAQSSIFTAEQQPTTVSDGKVCTVAWPPRPSPVGGTTAKRGTLLVFLCHRVLSHFSPSRPAPMPARNNRMSRMRVPAHDYLVTGVSAGATVEDLTLYHAAGHLGSCTRAWEHRRMRPRNSSSSPRYHLRQRTQVFCFFIRGFRARWCESEWG
jgi:hypothetical protein